MQSTTRNATLQDLAGLLTDQQARKVDIVASASKITAERGLIRVTGADPEITVDGVTTADGIYRPTAIFDEGIADKLNIPLAYVRRMREDRPDLWDANVNGWLHGERLIHTENQYQGGDPRSFLLRTFKSENGGTGIARAFLSDKYARIDNLDALTAALDGVKEAGVDVSIDGCDLTDRRMQVRVIAPQVAALAPALLEGYRSPFSGLSGTDIPTVWAGLVIANSEVGGGAFTVTPRIVFEVCNNGMTITKDAQRAVHLGGRLETGVIAWSEETQRKSLELVRSKTVDAVRSFLSPEYVEQTVRAMEKEAGVEVETVDEVKELTKGLSFTQDQTDSVLGFFIKGGQMTVGGVANAITAAAQTVPDGDTAADMEQAASRLLGV